MTEFSALFSPGNIGSLKTKNRVVMPPMVRNYADERGFVTPKYIAHIDRIARGGVGIMILEASFVQEDGKGFKNQLGLHTDDAIPGLTQLVEAAHAQGAVIGPQIFHAGRQTRAEITGMQPVAPSPIPDPTINEEPRALSIKEIPKVVEAFAKAARRAAQAGCDFVEIHGAHGYLITQFLSPFSNHRTDAYGESEEGRMRFPSEVVAAVRNSVGPEFPVTMRISADEMVPNGLTQADSEKIARRLAEMGVDALHVSVGNFASFNHGYIIAPMSMPDAPLVPFADWVKSCVDIPVIAVGKIRPPELADKILLDGKADFIAVGRTLLADPDWPRKAQEGRVSEIRPCIACNQGCISRLLAGKDVWCTVNPETSRELEFSKPITKAKKRVFIAGGGPAGMEAARVAAMRGHQVMLAEEQPQLGGALLLSAMPPQRQGWLELCKYLVGEMIRLRVDIRLGTKANVDLAMREGADVAIVAIGAFQPLPDIPGIMGENVVLSREILNGKANVNGNKVVVIGGGVSAAQIADFLSSKEYGVTIVGGTKKIAENSAVVVRELLLNRLKQRGVQMLTETDVVSVQKDRILIKGPGEVNELPGELPVDTVVLSFGSKPKDHMANELKAAGLQVFVVGDAAQPRDVTFAMLDGAIAGLSI